MTPKTVLVVDDNMVNLKLIQVVLTQSGYEVRTAADAKEALAVVAEIHPPVILMDIQLPDMDALEATRKIKADPATRDIRVLAVTAYAMKGDEQKAIDAGCDGYITKPIDTRSLSEVVARLFTNAASGAATLVTPAAVATALSTALPATAAV